MYLKTSLLENGFDIGNRGTLAVRPGHVDDWRQFILRVSQQFKNPHHALKTEIDDLGMQQQQPVQYGITARQGVTQRRSELEPPSLTLEPQFQASSSIFLRCG